ncbi:MAG TPA: metalloregulator ArsR/SmtB family transcription factor [Euzebya sp.]|nr:metalloregulator ArsR/SmtB family transcription factor [Euzebya sp.]
MTSASEPSALTDLLGDTRAAILTHVQARPKTAGELGEALGVSAAAVRRHLTNLAKDGLVDSETVRDGSMGRPHERWSLTGRGKRLFPDRSAEFADELLDHLEETYGRSAVAAFLKARAERHAARYADQLAQVSDPVQRVQHLAQALSEDGFAAHVGDGDNGRTLTLLQSHCAIEAIAREHPEVCAHEAALFKRLLGTKVSRRETIAGGAAACVCHIDLPDTDLPDGDLPDGDLSDADLSHTDLAATTTDRTATTIPNWSA